jgi:hypothetical protein
MHENKDFVSLFVCFLLCEILPALEFCDEIEKRITLTERSTDGI